MLNSPNIHGRRALAAAIFLAAFAIGGFFWQASGPERRAELKPHNPPFTEATGVDIGREQQRWRDRIAAAGPEAAYAEFKAAYAERHFSDQHIAIHVMGGLLYETMGITGLAVCDDTFAFGCYHSFFASAIGRGGTGIVADLDRECVGRLGRGETGCQHGIGHGLVEHLGSSHLAEALELCGTTTTIHYLLGCTSGVFMEYNTPIVIGATASQTLRELDRDAPTAPCPSLAERFRPSCYFELAPWWKNYFSYEDMGRLCAELAVTAEREACFLGIGYIIVPFNEYRTVPSLADCGRMPIRDGELLCRAGMWWSYFVVPERRPLADDACAGLTPAEQSFCGATGRLVQ